MRIINRNVDTTLIVVGEASYEADEQGLFDVPDELGRQLVGFPDWQEWDGTQPTRGAAAPTPPAAPAGSEPTTDLLPDGWERGRKADLIGWAGDRGLDTAGTVEQLRERLTNWQIAARLHRG